MPWAIARKSGFAYVTKVNEKDARVILDFLHITAEMTYSDGFGDLTLYNIPRCWLQRCHEAGGDCGQWSVEIDCAGELLQSYTFAAIVKLFVSIPLLSMDTHVTQRKTD